MRKLGHGRFFAARLLIRLENDMARITPKLHQQLQAHQKWFDTTTLHDLFCADTSRARQLSFESAGVRVDLSKNHLTSDTLDLLIDWAESCHLPAAIEQLFGDHPVNRSENRRAGHLALRDLSSLRTHRTMTLIERFIEELRSGRRCGSRGQRITDVVTLGIGGSDLGARLAVDALSPYRQLVPACHFVANLDGVEFEETVSTLNPHSTLFVVASKSFTTRETLLNAGRARRWLTANGILNHRAHFVAVTSNQQAVKRAPVPVSEIFVFDADVGGRFSLWSSIGLPIALSVGMDNFRLLLLGAAEMDCHFRTAPLSENIPILLALTGAWYTNYWGCQSRAVLPYVHGLRGLPGYLRQLEMESNGKSVMQDGRPVEISTSGVVWGASGAIGQHSFSQMLHQGTHMVPVEFISVLGGHSTACDGYTELFANCLSQARVLMTGKSADEVKQELNAQGIGIEQIKALLPHKIMPGNRPSTTILLDKLTPHRLGALLAMYEHKVYAQSVLWGINAFDQWGVEYGKQISGDIYQSLKSGKLGSDMDSSTREMMRLYLLHQHAPAPIHSVPAGTPAGGASLPEAVSDVNRGFKLANEYSQ